MSVAWVGAGIAAVGAVSSIKSGNAAAKAAQGANAASMEQVALARDQLKWEKEKYAGEQGARDAAEARAQQVSDSMLTGMNFANQEAQDLSRRNKTIFQPLEDRIVSDAKYFDEGARGTELAGLAGAEVDQAFSDSREQGARALSRQGVAPGSGRSLALNNQVSMAQALAKSGAMTKARRDASTEGYARRMDAVGLGKGIVGNQTTQQQIATSSGNSSASSAMAGLSATSGGGDGIRSGYGSVGNSLNSFANSQMGMARLYGNAANDGASAVSAGMQLFGKYYKPKEG